MACGLQPICITLLGEYSFCGLQLFDAWFGLLFCSLRRSEVFL